MKADDLRGFATNHRRAHNSGKMHGKRKLLIILNAMVRSGKLWDASRHTA